MTLPPHAPQGILKPDASSAHRNPGATRLPASNRPSVFVLITFGALVGCLLLGLGCFGQNSATNVYSGLRWVVSVGRTNEVTDKATLNVTNPADGSLRAGDGHYIIEPWLKSFPGKLSGVLITNWTTTSIERPIAPASPQGTILTMYIPDVLHQSGIVLSNTVATLLWKSNEVRVTLESVELLRTNRTTTELQQRFDTWPRN